MASQSPPASPSTLAPFFDPSTGKPVSFARLMASRRHPSATDPNSETFISATKPFSPLSFAYGGHVYAQAALVASRTVERGMYLHNVSGHFILPGRLDVPFTYHVHRLRSGGSYALRLVEVYQDDPIPPSPPSDPSDPSGSSTTLATSSPGTPSFIATISFKRPELYPSYSSSSAPSPRHPNASLTPDLPSAPPPGLTYIPFSHQTLPPNYLSTRYPVLLSRPFDSHPYTPAADFTWWADVSKDQTPHPNITFPGVEMRKVDLTEYNRDAVARDGPGAYRMLLLYRMIMPEESPLESPSSSSTNGNDDAEEEAENNEEGQYWKQLNLSAAAHLYASDRNGLFLIAHALGFGNGQFRITSLSHSVVLHAAPEKLLMTPPPKPDERGGTTGNSTRSRSRWFIQEAWSSVSGGNRAMHQSRLFSWDDDEEGTGAGESEVLASTFQEGMCRLVSKEFKEGEWEWDGEGRRRAKM